MQILLYSLVAVLLMVGSGFAATQQRQAPSLGRLAQTDETAMHTPASSYAQTVSAAVEVGGGSGPAPGAAGAPGPAGGGAGADGPPPPPFRVDVPEGALFAPRQRIAMTRGPERETVA